ncbi:Ubiquitin-conjugating enzyme E2 6 [Coemansia sp. Benny D115]|nr:Ubiquitin-conjugating enzyme E2 6 [Coemansia sp. Benny D115]
MASRAAFKRLSKEYLAIQTTPTPYITAKPLEENILEWHYVLRGPPDTPYAGGEYHGRLKFPADYPYKPPAIQMITPSGRFQTNTNICMSMSNFHPNTWNPAWSVSTILNGMLSFMVEDEVTTGSIRTSVTDRKALARKSHAFNLANRQFCAIFPELCTPEPAPLEDPNAAPSQAKATAAEAAAKSPVAQVAKPAVAAAAARSTASAVARQQQQQQMPRAAAAMPLAGPSRKWIILFVVLAYLLASKAVSRLLNA